MIYVALRVRPVAEKRLYAGKLPHEGDQGAERLAMALVERLDGRGVCVAVTDAIPTSSHGTRPGVWGVDEPDPWT